MDERCKKWGEQEDALQEFKDWYNSKPHLPQNIPDDYLAQFLHSCHFNLEQAKKAIEVFFKLKTSSPEFFNNRTLENEALSRMTKVSDIFLLPETTEEGYSVIMTHLVDTNPSNLVVNDVMKFIFMLVDLVYREWPGCPGIVFVHDMFGSSFRHLLKISMFSIKKYFEYTQDGCPMRLKGIHFVNSSAFLNHLLVISKPFVYKENYDVIKFHNNAEIDTFLKFLKISNIPKDYGGEAPKMAELQEETLKKLRAYDAWFKFDESLWSTDATTKATKFNKVEKKLNNLSIT